MHEKMQGMLKEVIFEVMETMYFLCLEAPGPGESAQALDGGGVAVRISTLEPEGFGIELRFTEALLRRISENLFEPGEVPRVREGLKDLALETANMVGGAFLCRLDPERRLMLSLPEIVPLDQRGPAVCHADLYFVEGEPFLVRFLGRDESWAVSTAEQAAC